MSENNAKATPKELKAIKEELRAVLDNEEFVNDFVTFDETPQIRQESGGLQVQVWVYLPDFYVGGEPDGIDFETPPDTPSLDTSLHDHEMDVDC